MASTPRPRCAGPRPIRSAGASSPSAARPASPPTGRAPRRSSPRCSASARVFPRDTVRRALLQSPVENRLAGDHGALGAIIMHATNPSPARTRIRQRTIMVDGPHPIDVHVGARIRAQRVVRGLTQSELAKLVGISFQSVQKYEQGENRVSASRLYEFAAALGVAPQHFFDGLDARKPDAAVSEITTPAVGDDELQRHLLAGLGGAGERPGPPPLPMLPR